LFHFSYLASPPIYSLSLHDALPIFVPIRMLFSSSDVLMTMLAIFLAGELMDCVMSMVFTPLLRHCFRMSIISFVLPDVEKRTTRSEEHTSELQSRFDLVCRLLLAQK